MLASSTRRSHRRLSLYLMLLAALILACTCPLLQASTWTAGPNQGEPGGYPTLSPNSPEPERPPTHIPGTTSTADAADTVASSTECQPTVTATQSVNVRKGPSKAYDDVGTLTAGQSASVLGRSESQYGEWWYIQYSAAPDGHGWVWGAAVSQNCIPVGLPVVAAAGLPQAQATNTGQAVPTNTEQPPPPGGGSWGVSTTADLEVTDIRTYGWPQGKLVVDVRNNGPDDLYDIPGGQVSCTVETHYYSGIHPIPPVLESNNSLPNNIMTPGTTLEIPTGIQLDGSDKWFTVTCTAQANWEDPVPGNNSRSETFPPPP